MFMGGSRSTPKSSAPKPGAKPIFSAKKKPASPTRPKLPAKPKPLSPGSNYPGTKNIQIQSSGFGNWMAKFKKVSDVSEFGVPIYLPNGNINPAYLAAERKAQLAQKRKNNDAERKKTAKMVKADTFELAGFIRKKIGNVGSGKDYYDS